MTSTIEIRTLRHAEREALLELLDGWPVPDGWRGRDFFRRYLEDDPVYRDENVWVAEEAGRLVSCVQVFPRTLRSTAGEIPCAGIGTVFTAQSHRGRGLASSLLEAAARASRERGMEVSLLVAGRLRWYSSLGWRVWVPDELRLRRRARWAPRALDSRAAGRGRDPWHFEELGTEGRVGIPKTIQELSEHTSSRFVGTVVRDANGWAASQRLAGNPNERFLAATRGGEVVAFVRTCVLARRRHVTEWGYRRDAPDSEAALADLVASQVPAIHELALSPVRDEAVLDALVRRGMRSRESTRGAWMLRCLDRDALCRRLAGSADSPSATSDEEILERLFPRSRFGFWTADRF